MCQRVECRLQVNRRDLFPNRAEKKWLYRSPICKIYITFAHGNAAVAQLVEHQLPKLRVAGSNPVCRSLFKTGRYENNGLFLFIKSPRSRAI